MEYCSSICQSTSTLYSNWKPDTECSLAVKIKPRCKVCSPKTPRPSGMWGWACVWKCFHTPIKINNALTIVLLEKNLYLLPRVIIQSPSSAVVML